MSKHTPAPWVDIPHMLKGVHDGHVVTDHGGAPLAFLYHEKDNIPPAERVDANARLVAAAPDLLTACERLLNVTEEKAENYSADSDFFKAVDFAAEIVAKAKGGA